MTYLTLKRNGKRAYLSTILDLETRDWVAYKIGHRNDNELVMDTLREAIKMSKEKDLNGLVLHSDQGFQYLSTEYKVICESNGIIISHSRKGNPLDNAVIESFHSILKKETLYNNDITSLKDYVQLVHEWMIYYNTYRPKSQKSRIAFFKHSTFWGSVHYSTFFIFIIKNIAIKDMKIINI
ncbi:DDE-type integrase/transposase/recombinase [Mycoplasmatota bacterium]|nr:DDE-type integrase/transposase/recombinase [Mycoplasmatota bacterium]